MAKTPLNSLGCSGEQRKDNEILNNSKPFIRKTILKALDTAKRPLTRRELNLITKIDRETLCLPLLRLVQFGTLYYANQNKCAITGKRVYHYTLSSWKGQNNAK